MGKIVRKPRERSPVLFDSNKSQVIAGQRGLIVAGGALSLFLANAAVISFGGSYLAFLPEMKAAFANNWFGKSYRTIAEFKIDPLTGGIMIVGVCCSVLLMRYLRDEYKKRRENGGSVLSLRRGNKGIFELNKD